MQDFLSTLRAVEEAGSTAIRAAETPEELERLRVKYLGRKAPLTRLLRGVAELPEEQRRSAGAEANRVKKLLLQLLDEQQVTGGSEKVRPAAELDPTLPGRERWLGARHPCTLVIDEICGIFKELGFVRVRGPEAETTWYNFTALNTPLDHPAADEQDTFYLSEDIVLRTHTSPVQARVMEKWKPPVRVVVPGLVYRRDLRGGVCHELHGRDQGAVLQAGHQHSGRSRVRAPERGVRRRVCRSLQRRGRRLHGRMRRGLPRRPYPDVREDRREGRSV